MKTWVQQVFSSHLSCLVQPSRATVKHKHCAAVVKLFVSFMYLRLLKNISRRAVDRRILNIVCSRFLYRRLLENISRRAVDRRMLNTFCSRFMYPRGLDINPIQRFSKKILLTNMVIQKDDIISIIII